MGYFVDENGPFFCSQNYLSWQSKFLVEVE